LSWPNPAAALHLVARHNRNEVVHVLLEHGANVAAEDNQGRTPLNLAVEGGVSTSRPTRAARAWCECRCGGQPRQNSPLHVESGSDNGTVDVVRVLLEHDANVDTKAHQGRTPFYIASASGYNNIIKLLSDRRTVPWRVVCAIPTTLLVYVYRARIIFSFCKTS
jgi:hypothetical protein